VVGGIVFDSALELRNMLASGVAGRPGMHAFLVTPEGRVLCATDPAYPAGAVLALERALLDAAAGEGAGAAKRIVVHAGQFTSLGLAANAHALSRSLIKANGGEVLVQELSAQQIVARVCGVGAEAV